MSDRLIIIVGAGITGLTLAERFANDDESNVLLIEKRDHIGGNCYDFTNENGVLVSKYGPHIFHTNDEKVWSYISKFGKWEKYEHRVLSLVKGQLVPIPVNIKTINLLFGENLKSEKQMMVWLDKRRDKSIVFPKNSQEVVISKLGKEIYELMYKDYTKKQWDMWPEELGAEILARIPVRYNFDDRYQTDKYQMRSVGGLTKVFEKMLSSPKIELRLKSNFFEIYKDLPKKVKIIFTGPIDDYAVFMGEKVSKLPYRSINFKWENYQKDFHQAVGVINYPSFENEEVRSTEYKYLTGQKSERTTISREYFHWGGEPYYPVITEDNLKRYDEIRKKSKRWKNVYFAGRLGRYKYINMDQAVKEALELYEEIK
jgi:UDP-galactopyranose mutase